MDNLRVHKAEAVRQRIEARGCQVVFLPRYSPDFNPIEGARVTNHTVDRRPEGVVTCELPKPGA
jgi:transposase